MYFIVDDELVDASSMEEEHTFRQFCKEKNISFEEWPESSSVQDFIESHSGRDDEGLI